MNYIHFCDGPVRTGARSFSGERLHGATRTELGKKSRFLCLSSFHMPFLDVAETADLVRQAGQPDREGLV
jgi:hypothetical protein